MFLFKIVFFFSRKHATLDLAVSVVSVGQSVDNIFLFEAIFAILLLPNRLQQIAVHPALFLSPSLYN